MRGRPNEIYLREDRAEVEPMWSPSYVDHSAISGSACLLERMEKQFFKFGWRHGISPLEARHLLLNTGVKVRA